MNGDRMTSLVVHTILFALTIFGSYRHSRALVRRSIMFVMYRDGIWAYICILGEYHHVMV